MVRAATSIPLSSISASADDQQLDFTELAFQIGDEPQPALQSNLSSSRSKT